MFRVFSWKKNVGEILNQKIKIFKETNFDGYKYNTIILFENILIYPKDGYYYISFRNKKTTRNKSGYSGWLISDFGKQKHGKMTYINQFKFEEDDMNYSTSTKNMNTIDDLIINCSDTQIEIYSQYKFEFNSSQKTLSFDNSDYSNFKKSIYNGCKLIIEKREKNTIFRFDENKKFVVKTKSKNQLILNLEVGETEPIK